MAKTHNIASFVLRFTQDLWQDMQGKFHVRWRGQIRHVQGDEEERFTDFAEMVTFMQRYLTQLTMDTLSGDKSMSQEKVFQESIKLWEQFASSYSDMMFKAMEQTVKQSESFQEQAVKAWQLPIRPNRDQIIEAFDKLQDQIEKLTNRVEMLEKELAEKNLQQEKKFTPPHSS